MLSSLSGRGTISTPLESKLTIYNISGSGNSWCDAETKVYVYVYAISQIWILFLSMIGEFHFWNNTIVMLSVLVWRLLFVEANWLLVVMRNAFTSNHVSHIGMI